MLRKKNTYWSSFFDLAGRKIFPLVHIFFLVHCMTKLDFNNSGDTKSSAFLYRSFLSDYLASITPLADNSLSGEIPQYLSALLFRSGQSLAVRVYPVDSENGNLGSYFEYARVPSPSGISPGCDPSRILRIPRTNEILVAGGSNNKLFSFQISDSQTISPYANSASIAQGIKYLAVTPDGKNIFTVPDGNGLPDSLFRFSRSSDTGSINLESTGGYPFGLACGPRSVALAPNGNNIFISTISSTGGIYGFVDTNGVISAASTNPTLPANITSNDNLCLHPTKSFLYTTLGQVSGPIVGLKYDSNSNLSYLPSSPFTPSSNYSGTQSTKSRTLAIDPLGKFVAFLYNESSSKMLQLLTIDQESGALTPTNKPVSVGNAPNALEWDKSGRYLYFVSDDLTNYQIEVYRVLKDGSLQKTLNSPYPITTISGTGAIPIGLSSITKTSTVKIGEFP